jgi:hypothetical protein
MHVLKRDVIRLEGRTGHENNNSKIIYLNANCINPYIRVALNPYSDPLINFTKGDARSPSVNVFNLNVNAMFRLSASMSVLYFQIISIVLVYLSTDPFCMYVSPSETSYKLLRLYTPVQICGRVTAINFL